MSEISTNTGTEKKPFAWDELPGVVADYLRAHVEQDYEKAVSRLSEDVVVLDNGEVLEGREATLRLFNESKEQYEAETTLHTVSRPADDVWEVGTHLSGNFPGNEVDLRMLFTLVDDLIRRLEITV